MNHNDATKFNISIDEESPDSQFQEDVDEPQAVKLNKRITRTSILVITLTGVIILFAYIDLKRNIFKMSSSGDTEIQTLSKGVQSTFSSLSMQQVKFAEALTEKIVPLEKAIITMQANLKDISTAIKQIRSARKSDNKKTADAIEAINKTLAPVSSKLEDLASGIDQVKQQYANELSSLSRATTGMQHDIQKLQADLNVLSSSQLDETTLDVKLARERNIFNNRLEQLKSDMESRLYAIKKKINELEKMAGSLEKTLPTAPKEASRPQKQGPRPVDENTKPQNGSIIEQDID